MDNYRRGNKLPVKHLNYHIMYLSYPKLMGGYLFFITLLNRIVIRFVKY